MKPEDAGQLEKDIEPRTKMGFEPFQKELGGQQPVLAHQRHDLVRRGEEGDKVDEAEQPQDDKARQPV